jgi:ADP-ribose pyrophosphatase
MGRMDDRIVSDELVYAGTVVRLHKVGLKVSARQGGGAIVSRDLVEMVDAAVIVPVCPDGRLVLVRNERFAVGEELLEFPAGKIDGDEDPAACAERELQEETGYTAKRLVPLGGFFTSPGAISEYIHAFLATGLTAGPQKLEAYENIRTELVDPRRLGEMIAAGELHDAKSIAAYALWRLRSVGGEAGIDGHP